MLGLVSYLLQIDRETWQRFKTRLADDGLKVGETIRALIERYIEHGFDDTPKKGK